MTTNPTVTVNARDLAAWLTFTGDFRHPAVEATYARLHTALARQCPAVADFHETLIQASTGDRVEYRRLAADGGEG
jgi:hypothetical protein